MVYYYLLIYKRKECEFCAQAMLKRDIFLCSKCLLVRLYYLYRIIIIQKSWHRGQANLSQIL